MMKSFTIPIFLMQVEKIWQSIVFDLWIWNYGGLRWFMWTVGGPIIIKDRRWQALSDNVWIPVLPCSRTFFAELSFLMIIIMVTKAMFIFSRINTWWWHVWYLDRWILFCPSLRSISCPTSTWNHRSNIVTELFREYFYSTPPCFENCRFSLPRLEVVLLSRYFFFK